MGVGFRNGMPSLYVGRVIGLKREDFQKLEKEDANLGGGFRTGYGVETVRDTWQRRVGPEPAKRSWGPGDSSSDRP